MKTIIVLTDKEVPFKDIVIMFKAKFAWMDGKKYWLPLEKWIKEKSLKSLT